MINRILLLTVAASLAACASSGKSSSGSASPLKRSSAQTPVGRVKGSSGTAASASAKAAKPATASPAGIALDYAIGEVRASGDSDVPDAFKAALRQYLKAALSEGGRLAAAGRSSRTVEISLSEYRQRDEVAGDHVTSAIVVKDRAGEVIGESSVNSSSGLLDAGNADALAKIHAGEIARFLMGAPLRR